MAFLVCTFSVANFRSMTTKKGLQKILRNSLKKFGGRQRRAAADYFGPATRRHRHNDVVAGLYARGTRSFAAAPRRTSVAKLSSLGLLNLLSPIVVALRINKLKQVY